MKRFFLRHRSQDASTSFGLLVFRLTIGSYMLTHGLPKLLSFGDRFHRFSDPIGLGSEVSLIGTVFGEVFCASAIILGLYTRIASIGMGFVMATAAFVAHSGDPFSTREKALLFFSCCVLLFFAGAGNYSLDRKLLRS